MAVGAVVTIETPVGTITHTVTEGSTSGADIAAAINTAAAMLRTRAQEKNSR